MVSFRCVSLLKSRFNYAQKRARETTKRISNAIHYSYGDGGESGDGDGDGEGVVVRLRG